MKATLEFNLPEEQEEFAQAAAAHQAFMLIEDLLSEIRTKLKYDSGAFNAWKNEEGETHHGHNETLEMVQRFIWDLKLQRNLPRTN